MINASPTLRQLWCTKGLKYLVLRFTTYGCLISVMLPLKLLDERLQRSEQYLTSSHTFSHFLRHVKGRSHTTHIFCGKSAFFIVYGSLTIKQVV